jgi:hypothetical protein
MVPWPGGAPVPSRSPVRALIREPGPPFTGTLIRCRDSTITNLVAKVALAYASRLAGLTSRA